MRSSESSARALNVEDREQSARALADDGTGPPPASTSIYIIVTSSIAYCCVYFLRYPITYTEDMANQVFGTVFGVELLLKDSLSLAFLLGFALAKIPAASVMTSPLFFNHRFLMITLLNTSTGLLVGLPCALSNGDPMWTTLGMFLGVFPTSWVYGGMFTYFEGRVNTELILAFQTAAMIQSGSLSRGFAQWMVSQGVPEAWMPFYVFLIVLVPMTVGFYFLDKSEKPNAYEMKHRQERTSMPYEKKIEFASSYWFPLVTLVCVYSTFTAMRQFRDLDTRTLYKAANGGVEPPTSFVTFIDLGPAVSSFIALNAINTIADSYSCLNAMMFIEMGSCFFLLLVTFLFNAGFMNPLVWHACVAIGIMTAYTMAVPMWDRMVASSPLGAGATSTFIMYIADMMGYVFAIAVVFWKRFAAPEETMEILLEQFIFILVGGSVVCIVLIVISLIYFKQRREREENTALAQETDIKSFVI